MRDHSNHIEVSREQAVELLGNAVTFNPKIETVKLDVSCVGRVLAADAVAKLDMPNCLTCKMDSVAVHWDDFKDGAPDTTGWQRGRDWEFANTGIGMPEGFDTAIVIEHVVLSEDNTTISFNALPSKQYAGTSPAGSRMRKGDVLVPAGSMLTPLLISHIASGNNTEVSVIARPKVAFIPTGSELVVPGSEIPRGKNIETNSLLAAAKIAGWGGECIVWDIIPDDPDKIKVAVLEAVSICDIVVVNAGSSKGSDDWNIEMLEEIGQVLYHETNHGPGHHSSGSVVEGVPIVGISGPPGGAAFTMDFYLYPLMRRHFGQSIELKKIDVRLMEGFSKKDPQQKKPSAETAKGEARPNIVADGREFFGIKQLKISMDGTEVWALPATTSHVGAPEAETMDCYFALSSLRKTPQKGDTITVDLRP
ncbi:MAG: molybdopterin biosynthesis protein [Eggerthellaceae bacterium]|nr:molybdopterin biosynthesis protein [Eggerthellaceae bacterium]